MTWRQAVTRHRNKAILVIDMLKDFIEEGAPLEVPAGREIIEAVRGEIDYYREKKRLVFFVNDTHKKNDLEFKVWPRHAVKGTPGAEVIPELKVLSSDTIIEKTSYSGFFETDLDQRLKERGVTYLTLVGVTTNICILFTAVDALMRGYEVVVPETCVAALTDEDHNFALRQINEVLKPCPG